MVLGGFVEFGEAAVSAGGCGSGEKCGTASFGAILRFKQINEKDPTLYFYKHILSNKRLNNKQQDYVSWLLIGLCLKSHISQYLFL